MAILIRLLLLTGPLLAAAADHVIVFRVSENVPTGSRVGNLKQVEQVRSMFDDKEQLDGARFDLFPSDLGKILFSVDRNTGIVSTTSPINREHICRLQAQCVVTLHVQLIPPASPGSKQITQTGSKVLQVRVEVEDKNDNAPEFANPKVDLQVPENSPPNSVFGLPPAVDADTPANGVSKYTMNDTDGVFGLVVERQPILAADGSPAGHTLLPKLKQKRALDRERQAVYRYTLSAIDKDGHQGSLTVRVQLVDVNDNAPVWDKSPYTFNMPECSNVGTALLTLRATDKDDGAFGRVRYSIASSAPSSIAQMFYINGDDLFANENPDFEKERHLVVPLVAEDGGRLQTPNSVRITVEDCNDNRPSIAVRPGDAHPRIRENVRSARVVATLLVDDKDSGENGRTTCSMDKRDHFQLTEDTERDSGPRLYSLLTLPSANYDREEQARFRVTISCHDFGNDPQSARTSLTVEVEDENDNPPQFRKPLIQLSIPENNHIGDLVGSVLATDPDNGQNGVVSYQLPTSEPARAFSIDTHGNLRARVRFDREVRDEYRFTVLAHDNGKPQNLNATATVVVRVSDLNDNAPRFNGEYRFQVTEADGMGRLSSVHLGRVNASDPDAGPNGTLRYSLTEFVPDRCRLCFVIGQDGSLSVNGPIDREVVAQYRFKVKAVDQGYPESRTGTAWVLVTVRDLNDNMPVFRFPKTGNSTVTVRGDTPVGHQVAQMVADDPDDGENKDITYSLNRESPYFHLEDDGRLILKKELPQSPVRTRQYRLVVLAANPNMKKATSAMMLVLVRWPRPRYTQLPDNTNRGSRPRPGFGEESGGSDGRRDGGHRRGSSRSNSLLLLILTAASVIVFILVVTIFALVYLRKIPCQGSSASKRRRRPPAEEEKAGSTGMRQEELFPIQTRGLDVDKMACEDQIMVAKLCDKTLQKRPPPSYSVGEKGSAPSLLDRQASGGGNYAYIPAPTFETLDRRCGSGDSVEAELSLNTGTGKLSRKCYRPTGAESHAYTELEVRDVLLPEFAGSKDTATYQNTLKPSTNSHWALNNSGTAQRTPVITSSFV